MSGLRIPTNTWMNSVDFLASAAHTLGGAMIVVLATVFFGFAPAWWIAWLGIVIAAGIKEYWFDSRYELPKQTFYDNTLDFVFYQVGAGAGSVTMALAHHLHRIS